MKNRTRKAFTLVELVIVIAVIAILAAVMIPTFGAIIDSANKASDQSTAANLTVALSQKINGIKTEKDLYDVIKTTFSEEFANSIAPKTASKGNHYWYNASTNSIILAHYDDLDDYVGNTAYVDSGVSTIGKVEGISTFAPNSYRTMSVTKGTVTNYFYLIDKGGDIGTILNTFDDNDDTNNDVNGLIAIKNSTEASEKNKSLAEAIYNRLGVISEVKSFDIRVKGTGTQEVNGVVYVPYDLEVFGFEAHTFTGTVEGIVPSNTTVTWSVADNDFAKIDAEKGIVTIVGLPEIGSTSKVTVTATAENGGKTVSKEIAIVRVDSAELSTEISGTGTISLYDISVIGEENIPTYTLYYNGEDGKTEYTIGSLASRLNWPSAGVTCDETITITTSGSAFDIDNSKLTLKGVAGEQIVTVTVGKINVGEETKSYITAKFKVVVIDNSNAAFATNTISKDNPIGENYLFRVGNSNAFAIGKLFNNVKPAENVVLEIYDVLASANGSGMIGITGDFTATVNKGEQFTYTEGNKQITCWKLDDDTWETATIKFTGTGIAKIRIGNKNGDTYNGFEEIYVEVVNGKNVTTYSELAGSNNVLLSDIVMSDGGYKFLSGNFYGNGFTFDITKGTNASANRGILIASNATFDNVRIVGATYTTHTNSTGSDAPYSSAAIVFSGESEIVNSYVYGCRAPVRIDSGELTIKNSVIEGGRFANIDLQGGNLVFDNAITISTSSLGIVVDLGCTGTTIKGTIKQYNWMCKDDKSKLPTNYQSLIEEMFKDSAYQHNYNGKVYVNTGILDLSEAENTINVSGYIAFNVAYEYSLITVTRKVYTLPDTTYEITADDIKYRDDVYPFSPDQGDTKPEYKWEYPTEYDKTTGKLVLSLTEGESISLNPHFLSATKYGISLNVAVSMNDTLYKESIAFNEGGTYEVVYTITDDVIYDENGNRVTEYDWPTYTKTLIVQVNVVKAEAKKPTFTFYYGTNGKKGGAPYTSQPSANVTGNVVTINGVNYVSAGTSGGSNIGSTKINGQTIYYPIIDGIIEKGGDGTDFRRFYPIFKAVTISDNGTTYSYSSTKSMPTSLEWVSASASGSGNSYGNLPTGDPMLYSNKYLCRAIGDYGNQESGGTVLVQYRYVGADGETYVYYVQYTYYDEDEGSTCVTGDTLVTLADGSKVRIDSLTGDELVLTWDFYTGEYTVAPIAILKNHGYSDVHETKLVFSDGTEIKILEGHAFFDVEANEFVIIDYDNAADYLGREFVKYDAENKYSTVTLVDYTVEATYTEIWSILAAKYYDCMLNDLWTLSPADIDNSPAYFMPFEMGEGMKFDEAKMQADIEKYGIFTYEDFAEYCSYEEFVGFGFDIFKVSIGKGAITWEELMYMIDVHLQ